MARIETLTNRISNAEKKIESKRNTIVKKQGWIAKRKAKDLSGMTENERYWETCEINHIEDDILRLEREIKETETALEKYRAELNAEFEKAASRNVPAIVEFLNDWKSRMFNYYDESLVPCYEMKTELKTLVANLYNLRYCTPEYDEALKPYMALKKEYDIKTCCVYEDVEFVNRWGRPDKKRVKVSEGEWEYLRPYDCFDTYEQATAKLNADLRDEANRKYDFIIERVNAICGKITDATGLKVGAKGDLNGNIIGERGTAHVQTIGAGGYNIQCFHFRTLIHEVK